MKITHLVYIFLLLVLTIQDSTTLCEQNNTIVQHQNNICEIDYSQCSSSHILLISGCIGYRCKLELGGKCYYYSYQLYDPKRCLSECCGVRLAPIENYTSQQVSKCLSINIFSDKSPIDPPTNKLAIILGSVLGVIFFIVLTACICCRRKIKALWNSDQSELSGRGPKKISKQGNSEPQTNSINFILQASNENINYDKQMECTICLCGYNEIQTSCGHWFHLKCITTWIDKSSNIKCPNCNNEQINPIRMYCRQCHKPFAELKLNRKNELRSLKKLVGHVCSGCKVQ